MEYLLVFIVFLQMLILSRFASRCVILMGLLIYAFVWNWITMITGRSYPKPIYLGIVGYPDRIIGSFHQSNYTMLSPESQDKRWNEYKKYYIQYQSKLSETDLEHYVVYTTTYSGLANKLNGLISGLLLAMVTDRGFLCKCTRRDFTHSG